ncbi:MULTISPECIES: PIN domain-containing protein [unclassified Anabaena]|uniref:PIN domain-containing protein n=1 Tax=unclassified Anabaena TaxID=2619674 RepID=UPI0039C627BA
MIRILFDADLILEALMHRQEFTGDISKLLDSTNPLIQMQITEVGWQKLYTYAKCLQNHKIAKIVIYWLQAKIQVCHVNQQILQQARSLPLKDFESAVELACVDYWHLDAIVTHKPEDFNGNVNKLWVWSIADLCLRANLESQLQETII